MCCLSSPSSVPLLPASTISQACPLAPSYLLALPAPQETPSLNSAPGDPFPRPSLSMAGGITAEWGVMQAHPGDSGWWELSCGRGAVWCSEAQLSRKAVC